MWRFEPVQHLRILVRPLDEAEDVAAAVVDHYHAQLVRYLLVPERIAVIAESRVARDQRGELHGRIRSTDRRARAPIDAARAAVAEPAVAAHAIEQLCIARGCA